MTARRRAPRPKLAKPDWPDDPIVAEIRGIRAALWKKAEGDTNAYFDLMKRLADERRDSGSGHRPKPAARPKPKHKPKPKGRAA